MEKKMENEAEKTEKEVVLGSFTKNVVIPYSWVFEECTRFADGCMERLSKEEGRCLGLEHDLHAASVLTAQAMTAYGLLANLQHHTICNLSRHLGDAEAAAKHDLEMLEDLIAMGAFKPMPEPAVG